MTSVYDSTWRKIFTETPTVETVIYSFGYFYIALGSSMSMTFLVWGNCGLLSFMFFNESSLCETSSFLHIPRAVHHTIQTVPLFSIRKLTSVNIKILRKYLPFLEKSSKT